MLLLLLGLAADPIAFDGQRLKEGQACYTVTVGRDGEVRTIGSVVDSIERGVENGRDVWRVVSRQRMRSGEMQDTYVLDARTLHPLTYVNRLDGQVRVEATYSSSRVTGAATAEDGTPRSINVAYSKPIWDGHLYGPVLGALPLAAGAQFSIPTWNHNRGLTSINIGVVGSREVQVADAFVDAWVVSVEVAPGRRAEYLIGKADGADLGYEAGPMRQTPVVCPSPGGTG
jgi:hypothetical protein